MVILPVDVNQYCIYSTTLLEPSTPHAIKQILELIPLPLHDDHNKDSRVWVWVHPLLLHWSEESQSTFHVAHSAMPSNRNIPSRNIRLNPFYPHFVEQPARAYTNCPYLPHVSIKPLGILTSSSCISTMRWVAMFHMPLSR
jgi:hypothetical protein